MGAERLWSETYDRSLDDIFSIQDEIAAQVVEQLKITLLGEAPKVKYTNPEAFALFLQARYLGLQYTAEGFEQSNALYEQALAIDPNYAAAWAGLARNCINQTGSGLRPIHEGYPLAREMLQKALALDPDHAPAHARLGWIAMSYDNDLAAAARHMEHALALEPANLDIIGNTASLLVNLSRVAEAIALQQYVTTQDPISATRHSNLSYFNRLAGHWEKAIASSRTALQLSPKLFATATGIVGAVVTLMGMLAFPQMIKAGYDTRLAAGVVCAGGCLGILIPPSIMLIVYGAMASLSVVKLYAAAMIPGILLAGMYILYVIGVGIFKPQMAAPLPKGEGTSACAC